MTLATFSYFTFAGTYKQIWCPVLYAKLAYEGFFTITTGRDLSRGPAAPGHEREPLPELQPFYGVVEWRHFNNSRHVRKTMKKLKQSYAGCDGPFPLHLYNNRHPDRLWEALDRYQKQQHGSNWLGPLYFETMYDNFDVVLGGIAHVAISFTPSHVQCSRLSSKSPRLLNGVTDLRPQEEGERQPVHRLPSGNFWHLVLDRFAFFRIFSPVRCHAANAVWHALRSAHACRMLAGAVYADSVPDSRLLTWALFTSFRLPLHRDVRRAATG